MKGLSTYLLELGRMLHFCAKVMLGSGLPRLATNIQLLCHLIMKKLLRFISLYIFARRRFLYPSFVLVFGYSLLFFSFRKAAPNTYQIKKVILDAGHGGKDPGCHGKKAIEKEISLAVVKQLGKRIEKDLPNVKVIYTRKSDVFVELLDRASLANKNNADLFISIHCNSALKPVSGTETYTMGMHTNEINLSVAKRENSVILKEDNYIEKYNGFNPNSPLAHIFFANMQSAFIENSLKFAGKVEREFSIRAKRNSRGVKQAGFIVLWKTSMPSVLIELGYLTNAKEETYLNSKKGQEQMSDAIYEAFKSYKWAMENAGKEVKPSK
jgi:N-acetylmuramoyl-L-alanine amidase